jgi:hypothetical protein
MRTRVFLAVYQQRVRAVGTMKIIAFILAGVCILGVCQFCCLRRKQLQGLHQYRRPNVIESFSAIVKILEQSIAERSTYELDFEAEGRSLALRGTPFEWGANGTLLVDLSQRRSVVGDLISKTCTVYFRIGRGDRREFFYFSASSRGFEKRKSGLSRHLFLRLEVPTRLNRGQKRRYFRLQPCGEIQVTVSLEFPSHRDGATTLFANAPVEDISAGGLRVMVDDQPNLKSLSNGTMAILTVKLRPCYFATERAGAPDAIRLYSVILENAVTLPGRRIIRFQFLSREILNPGDTRPSFSEDLERVNEDITRWIHACQRELIRMRLEPPRLASITSRRRTQPSSPPLPTRPRL